MNRFVLVLVLALAPTSLLLATACTPDDRARRAAGPGGAWSDTLLAVNGTRLFVHREGAVGTDAPPLVVIHGGPVLDHGYLPPHLAPLGRDFELIYYDQRLSGRSDGVVDSVSVRLQTFVDDLEAVRVALGHDPIDIVAHSWGGLIAMAYAVEHRDRVRRLVLVSPMAPTAALWREEQRAQAERMTAADTAGLGALMADPALQAREPSAVEAALKHSFRSQFVDPTGAAQLAFHIEPDYSARSRQFTFMLPDLTTYDLVGALATLPVPTLVVYGEAEVGASIGGAALAAALPDVQVVEIERAGHFAFIERPERFLTVVRTFLEAPAPSGG
jgi:proline iminopeptidase